MSNRRTMMILLGLTVLAGGGRFWANSYFQTWDEGYKNHKQRYVEIKELAAEVKERRDSAVYGLGDSSVQSAIQESAGRSALGHVNTKPQGRNRNPDEGDFVLAVEFEDPEHRFTRNAIGTFLFNCEVNVPRLRTKKLVIRPAGEGSRKVRSGTDRDDLWRVDSLVFIKRSPTKTEAAKRN
ncbi:MAG: hypothetical protein HQ519_07150 [Planctomycetes bacterium]|nr:hypothetical protein [Planctomycetota bacterium]NQU48407.1 hypothetical protein [Planctomycetota bacterium]